MSDSNSHHAPTYPPKSGQSDQPALPPHSIEAEQSVLGALLLDNRAWDKVADVVTGNDFYHQAHRLTFEAIASLAERQQPFDALTVAERLKTNNQLTTIGGEIFLYELAQNTPSAANVKAYASIVHERSVLRRLAQVGTDIAGRAYHPDGKDTQVLLDQAEREVFKISETNTRGSGPVNISSLLASAANKIDELYHSDQKSRVWPQATPTLTK